MTRDELAATVYRPPRASRPWRLAEIIGHDRLRYYALGRQALAEALLLAGASGRTALFPEFICAEVMEAARAAGTRVLFYPVGRDLAPASDQASWPKAAAVLAADYFGFPQDLAPFRAYAERAGAVLIEDAAHGLFSRDSKGAALGARAALGVLSPRKSLALPNGGALVLNDERLAAQAPPQGPFANPNGLAAAAKAGLRGLAPWLGARATLGLIGGGRRLKSLLGARAATPASEGAPRPCAALGGALRAADPDREVARRRELYALCGGLLGPLGVEPVLPSLPAGAAPYAFPFRAAGAPAAAAEERLRSAGLFSLPWPELPNEVLASAPAHYRDVRLAHFLW